MRVIAICGTGMSGVIELGAQNSPPALSRQPVSKAVLLGDSASFSVAASSVSPLTFQWQLNQIDLPLATNSTLSLVNLQFGQAGDYRAVVANQAGAVTSVVAHLSVGPAFLKQTSGPIATGTGGTGAAWGDFNRDGFVDLFVSVGNGSVSVLYTNDGAGSFAIDSAAGVGAATGSSWGCAGGDFNNDGNLDLLGSVYGGRNYLLVNQGNGVLTKTTGDPIVATGTGNNVAWADYDNDGFLDAYCAGSANLLFHNNGAGAFIKVTNSVAGADGSGQGCAWGDYDNDGFADLFVTRVNQPNLLYHNNRDGSFTKVTGLPFSADTAISQGCSWGDYDNDGLLDLVVCNNNARNFLYHNEGNGKFTKVTSSAIAGIATASSGSAWADYDNDGFLDLFIAVRGGANLLFHNNGDGTFTQVTTGTLVNDSGTWIGASWGDVNNDGFPDLFVGNLQGNNALYLNRGNSNNWLSVSCEGRISNRAAIGAKVRVKAIIGNRVVWQLREISGGGGLASQNDLRASFGLGDATNVDVLRIEWPSGLVQQWTDVKPRQFLAVREPSKLSVVQPAGGAGLSVAISGWPGPAYSLERSLDFQTWTPVAWLTNQTGSVTWSNAFNASDSFQIFRAREF